MIRNNLKILIRNFKRQKSHTLINLFGLAIGMISFLLISLYVDYEFSYDDFHKNASQLYRVRNDRIYTDIHDKSAGCPPAIGPALKDEFPEVIETARIYTQSGRTITYRSATKVITHIEEKIFYAENSFLRMFSFPIIRNSAENMLGEANTAIITESTAKKYFGDDDPLNKVIETQNRFGKQLYKITGILKDVPENSHVKFDILLSFENLMQEIQKDQSRSINSIWGWNAFNTYVMLNSKSTPDEVESRFPAFIKRHDLNEKDYQRAFSLQPIEDIHLYSHLRWEPEVNGNVKTINYLFITGIFILLVAWMNYINLATAKAILRSKEIGVRKVLGSRRSNLIKQFILESLLLNLMAYAIALISLEIILPSFAAFTDKPIVLSINNKVWIWLSLSVIGGSFLAGIYPAFVLSSYNPVTVLKGNMKNNAQGITLRKSLVVFQFVISIMLIMATLVVYRQLSYMMNQDLGININKVLVIKSAPQLNRKNIQKFKNELLAYPDIKKISISSTIPGKEYSNISSGIRPLQSNPEDGKRCFFIDVDETFFDLFEIPLVAGQIFTDNSRQNNEIVLNQQAVKLLGFGSVEDALNKKVLFGGLGGQIVDIIGIVKDFHQKSLNNIIEPVIFNPLGQVGYFSVKMDTRNIGHTLHMIEETWKNIYPNQPFEYNFLDDVFNAQYRSDQQFGRIFGLFTVLAIFISCLGLFGLISFSSARRTKEIGIRKVLGASMESVVLLLTKELLLLVCIANIIAWPMAWYAMNKWLHNFAYHIEISWWIFALAGSIALVIALLTIGWQTIRAATTNPVESLRYE